MTAAIRISPLAEACRRTRGRIESFRVPLFVGALFLFLGGAAYSAAQLELNERAIEIVPLIGLLVVLTPATLLYGAYGMVLLANAARVPMHLRQACRIATYATLAEALPLPGGAIVRTGALVGAGGGAGASTALVLGTAVLWIALAAAGGGLAMILHGMPLGWPMSITGASLALAISGWLSRVAGVRLAALMLVHRLLGLALFAMRLFLSFAVISVSVSLFDTLPFAFASIVGSASSIAPAGLGIGEALAGLIAHSVAVPATAAFLAVAINRIGGFAATAVIAGMMELAGNRSAGSDKARASAVHSPDAVSLHSGEYVERYLAKPLDRVRALARRMEFGSDARIADFGCGTGMLLHALERPFGSYDGVDFSPDFIAAADRWAAAGERTNYRFHLGDIREYCDANLGSFDIAVTLDFSEHVEDELAIEIYAHIRRSLRSGGRLYLHTPNLDFFIERAKAFGILRQFPEHIAVRNAPQTVALLIGSGFDPEQIKVTVIPHYNVLKLLRPLSSLPLIGRFFQARLWIEARV